jgi:hypothetical protein
VYDKYGQAAHYHISVFQLRGWTNYYGVLIKDEGDEKLI